MMANYQVLFSGEVAQTANVDAVRDNLARELGLDERKAKQLFSGRTVVIRSQLDQQQAQAWQDKLAQFGAICRIKDLTPKDDRAIYDAAKGTANGMDQTLRDITAAHLECPRCGHMQLDSSHCARCGVDLEQAFKQKRKEDLLIEKKIRELRNKREGSNTDYAATPIRADERIGQLAADASSKAKKGVLNWFKK
jgi:ribosomal protein L37E